MLQLVGLIAISWIVIWFFEKGNLSVLGLSPNAFRLKYASLLFFVSAALSATAFLLRVYFAKEEYTLSSSFTAESFLLETWYQIRSVLTEELICRGVLLYILLKKIGRAKAIVVSSLLFGVLHFSNTALWGNLTQMALVFVFTFSMGLLLAYSYAKSLSLLLPFAIHFGWNLIQNYVFPGTETGAHLFVLAGPPPAVTISYLSFFTMLLLPKISVLVADYYLVKRIPGA